MRQFGAKLGVLAIVAAICSTRAMGATAAPQVFTGPCAVKGSPSPAPAGHQLTFTPPSINYEDPAYYSEPGPPPYPFAVTIAGVQGTVHLRVADPKLIDVSTPVADRAGLHFKINMVASGCTYIVAKDEAGSVGVMPIDFGAGCLPPWPNFMPIFPGKPFIWGETPDVIKGEHPTIWVAVRVKKEYEHEDSLDTVEPLHWYPRIIEPDGTIVRGPLFRFTTGAPPEGSRPPAIREDDRAMYLVSTLPDVKPGTGYILQLASSVTLCLPPLPIIEGFDVIR